jgi:hypothetical protein
MALELFFVSARTIKRHHHHTPAFFSLRSRKSKRKLKPVDTDSVVPDRVKLIVRMIFGNDGVEGPLHARMREALKPTSIKGRSSEQQGHDSWVRQPPKESGTGGRGVAKYRSRALCVQVPLRSYDVTVSEDKDRARKGMSGFSNISDHLAKHDHHRDPLPALYPAQCRSLDQQGGSSICLSVRARVHVPHAVSIFLTNLVCAR